MKPQDKILVVTGTAMVLTVASFTGYSLFITKDADVTKTARTGTTSSSVSASSPTTTQQSSSAASATSTYKDGTYTTTTRYGVPHGAMNTVTVKLTVSGGTVTAVSTSHDYQDPESAGYIDWFNQDIESAVVGQSLGNVSVSRVGGASLTSMAFDNALDTIRSDARA